MYVSKPHAIQSKAPSTLVAKGSEISKILEKESIVNTEYESIFARDLEDKASTF